VQEERYLEIYHEKMELEQKSMENLRTIRDLEQEVKDLEFKLTQQQSSSPFGFGSVQSPGLPNQQQALLDLEKQKQQLADTKKQLANNFGIPQELLDHLKVKLTEKEAEAKRME
jgi:ribosomal protein L9